ncbi:MAG: hypothetical protein HRT45_15520 [Bdellovibrionales bacterium]|nr:hypothetical protein [Bdellovibrionales bacterium]
MQYSEDYGDFLFELKNTKLDDEVSGDLFTTHFVKSSRGPGWKDEMIHHASSRVSGGFGHYSSYWADRGDHYEACAHFDSDDYEALENGTRERYRFEFRAVKRIAGSQVTDIYLLDYFTVLTGANGNTCDLFEITFGFLNDKNLEMDARYIGRDKVGYDWL